MNILLIGSGGLSHEPPVPTMEHPDPAIRERITDKRTPTQQERDAIRAEHRTQMEARAREQGVTLAPQRNGGSN